MSVKRVLNKATGLEHDVSPTHWSLNDSGYTVLENGGGEEPPALPVTPEETPGEAAGEATEPAGEQVELYSATYDSGPSVIVEKTSPKQGKRNKKKGE